MSQKSICFQCAQITIIRSGFNTLAHSSVHSLSSKYAAFFNLIDSVCLTPLAIANAKEETAIDAITIETRTSIRVKPEIFFFDICLII